MTSIPVLSCPAKGVVKGGKAIPAQSAVVTMVLRSRYLRATEFTGHQGGAHAEQCSDEGGGQSLGFINSEDWISFSALDLQGSDSATFHVASAGSGGRIGVHADSAAGPMLGSATVASTGGWQKWINVDAVIKDPGGSHELVLVFRHDQNAGGLFNLNWVHFHQPTKK